MAVLIGLVVIGILVFRSSSSSSSKLHVVAMGDSYSAGVGLGEVTVADCDRDQAAYGPRAAALLEDRDVEVGLVACSGAVTANIIEPQRIRVRRDDVTVPPQLDAVSGDTDVATLTIGGNDIDFAGKVIDCLLGSCNEELLDIDPASNEDPLLTWELLQERLSARYLDIRREMHPDGSLFVLSYPIPFEITGVPLETCAGFDANEMLAANALSTKLGDTIEAAIDEANAALEDEGLPGHVAFVDWRVGDRLAGGYLAPNGEAYDYIDSPNGICSDGPYLNGFDPATIISGDTSNNFHPNVAGYEFAAAELSDAIADATTDRRTQLL